ncbi:MAG: hypothetical protein Kow0020_10040 [Wenzhouxiangellaceae bacterium]
MKHQHRLISTLLVAIALLTGGSALAALQIERQATITYDEGGTLVMITVAERDALGGESSTTATFDEFSVRADGPTITGELVRERVATGESVETVYNGTVEIHTPSSPSGPERLDTLTLENLTIVRDGDGPELSGTVIFNGDAIAAEDLPRPIRYLVLRMLRVFQFA